MKLESTADDDGSAQANKQYYVYVNFIPVD